MWVKIWNTVKKAVTIELKITVLGIRVLQIGGTLDNIKPTK
jgi:hypothetical protein